MAVAQEPRSKEFLERGSALLSRGIAAVEGGAVTVIGLPMPEKDRKRLRYRLSYTSNIPLTRPRGISVEISTACNLRCRICHQWKDSKGKQSLTKDDLNSIIDGIALHFPEAVLEFSGQEPTLNAKLLLDAMGYAKQRNVKTALSTNGMLIDRKFAERLLDCEPHHISVSLDSVTPATHDYLRNRKGSHKKAISAIKNLVAAKNDKNNAKNTAIAITAVVCDQTLEELPILHALGRRLGIDSINYNAFVLDNSYFLAENVGYENEFWVKGDRMAALRRAMEKLVQLQREGVKPTITNPLWQLRLMPSYFEKKDKFSMGRCLAGYNYFHIHKQGDVTVCGKGPFLNIKQYSLRDIWHSLAFYKTRRSIKRCTTPCINNCYVLT